MHVVGMQMEIAIMGNNMEISHKAKNKYIMKPDYPTQGNTSIGNEIST